MRRLFSTAGLALALSTLAALNAVAHFSRARLDLSAGRVYSLSPGTKAVLSRLQDDLVIRAYFTRRLPPPYGLTEQYLRDLLAEYAGAGRGKLRVELVDPDASEARKREALEAGIAPIQISVVSSDKFEAKEALMGAVLLYRGKKEVVPVVEGPDTLEYELTRRLKRLSDPAPKTVGFVTGHGEAALDDKGLEGLAESVRERMNVVSVDLAKPLDPKLDALWVLGPTKELRPAELSALKAWTAGGKTLGLFVGRKMVNFGTFQTLNIRTGLEDLLAGWGLEVGQGFVADAQCERIPMRTQLGRFAAVRLVDYPFLPIAKKLDGANPATRTLDSVTVPFAHPLTFKPAGSGMRWTALAESSHASWRAPSGDVPPSLPLAALSAGQPGPFALAGVLDAGRGKVIVIGSRYFLDPRLVGKATGVAFFLNLLDWSFQDQDLLSVRAKGIAYRPLRRLSEGETRLVKWSLILDLPLILLGAGWWLRERRRARWAAQAALYADGKA